MPLNLANSIYQYSINHNKIRIQKKAIKNYNEYYYKNKQNNFSM